MRFRYARALLADLISTLARDTRLCVACNLTGNSQSIRMQSIADWRDGAVAIERLPALFLLLA